MARGSAQSPRMKRKLRINRRSGSENVSQPRRKTNPTPPRTAAQYFAKPERFKSTYGRVIEAVSKMRSEKVSLSQASRAAGVSRRSVIRYGGPALRKRKNGKYAAKAKDNLLRVLMIPTDSGPGEIAVRGSQQASLLGQYWNAVHRYLQTGDASRLSQFEDKHIKDANGIEVPLPTDRAVLNRLGSAGVLSFESLYARTA